MTSQLIIQAPTEISQSLPPPPAMSPRCEDCQRKESCMCDQEADFDIQAILQDNCEACGHDKSIEGGRCADCLNEEREQEQEQEQEEEDDWPYKGNCENCGDDELIDGLCADCYWEEDSRIKAERRSNPRWVLSRAYSTMVVLLGKSKDEALAVAIATVKDRFNLTTEQISEIMKEYSQPKEKNE